MAELNTINAEEVREWIIAYDEGYEIPDEVMMKILYMAQLYAEQVAK